MHHCICGRNFREGKHLRQHENTCDAVKSHDRKLFATISAGPSSASSSGNRHHRELSDDEADDSSRFMGGKKRKRGSQSTASRLAGGPSSHSPLSMVDVGSNHGVDSLPYPDISMADAEVPADSGSLSDQVDTEMEPELPTQRVRRLTERALAMLADSLPEGPGVLQSDDENSGADTVVSEAESASPPRLPLRIRIRRIFKTAANKFGLVRTYHGRPSRVPKTQGADFIADDIQLPAAIPLPAQPPASSERKTVKSIIHPYPNISAFLYNRFHWKGGKKTKRGRKEFLQDVLLNEDFKIDDLRGVDFDRLDKELANNPGGVTETNGWKESTVPIYIPTGKKQTKASRREAASRQRRDRAAAAAHGESEEDGNSEDEYSAGRKYYVPHLHHRSLTDIVKNACSGPASKDFHWHPFEEHWTPPWNSQQKERDYSEIYSSQAFLDADRVLQSSPPEPGCDLPRCVVALMLYSDATHVAQFGQAKLWPIYADIGNGSKYVRGRPSANAGYNVAFLPSLPDSITDFILNDPSGKVSAPLLAHCRRELFHGCWKIILDDEFLEAYEHGIVIDCGDGIRRRIYPRIFFYSADYPEKVLVATVRDKGQCPCPRCKVMKDEVSNVGTPQDMDIRRSRARKDDDDRQKRVKAARSLIYQKGYVVNSTHVEDLLKGDSLVPTENAFSERLYQFGLNFFALIVVDLMHELELGIWKALILHLVRILYAHGQNTVHEFNARFRQVAAFGRSTIRKFPYDVADLSKLAARDYEDILQCCIPCFEGLLPSPHNETILDLLYILNYWHSLAKLRMHTDTTLRIFKATTILLGDALRYFANETCKHFKTFETDKEYQARNRATARRLAKESAPSAPAPAASSASTETAATPTQADLQAALPNAAAVAPQSSGGKRPKFFNLATPKTHFFPDYAEQIESLGTTDNLSTKLGESRHTRTKGFNNRTNFNNATPQIIGMDVREAVHDRMTHELEMLKLANSPTISPVNSVVEPTELERSYHMARDEKNKIYLPDFLAENEMDPAYRSFLPRLKTYLLLKKSGSAIPGEDPKFSNAEFSDVIIKDNFIFSHATVALNYTTYDLRRDQDTVNVNSGRRDVMLPSFEDNIQTHPYWYARVLGVYHTNMFYGQAAKPERVDFLFVRWFGRDVEWNSGPSNLRLDRLGFVPSGDADAFGFLDPKLIIRASHLIPAFALKRTLRLLGRSTARDSPLGDWENYYINRFVDRDMMMRYVGTGVGHCQSADFPREDGQLKKALTGDSYIQTAGQEGNESESIHSAPANPSLDEGDLDEEEEYDFGNGDEHDNDSFDEEMYEM